MQTDTSGRGYINLLASDKLMQSPRAYSTLLLWLLSELFERLPEVGDLEKPRLVFFFDEAHLLFTDAPAALLEKIEQVVRLIRSKGVGIYFVTQNPIDIPQTVLGQLGQQDPARAARLHATRPQGRQGDGGELPAEPGRGRRDRRHPAVRRRGARLAARRDRRRPVRSTAR